LSQSLEPISDRGINRAVLARQHLLVPSTRSLPETLEAMAGIQAQYAPSMYVSLYTRQRGFQREALTAALVAKEVVQGTLMRATIHLVSAADYWPLAIAVGPRRREWWSRVQRVDQKKMEAAAQRLAGAIAEGPRHRSEIEDLLGKEVARGVGLFLDLVRVPPSGTWERRRADLYAAADQWLGPPPTLSQEEAVDHLVTRYLGGFGPAPPAAIANWAGLGAGDISPSLDRLQVRRFVGEDDRQLVDLPDAPLPDPTTPAPIRFLPTWDATLLVHARRSGILPEQYRPRIFTAKNPQSASTFLIDGAVAGAWREKGGEIVVEPFRPLGAGERRAVAAEAGRLQSWFG
jgi:hypothetical protein